MATTRLVAARNVDVLGEPLKIGSAVARNRVWMAPMSVCYADSDGYVTAAEVEHYGRRASGGAGVVITENVAISASGRQLPRQTMLSDDTFIRGLSDVADAVHAGGALAILQLVHAGRYAGPWSAYEARRRIAPSAVEFALTRDRMVTPAKITVNEINDAIGDFSRAAKRAQRAGFDGVHIHGAQGFLISQFLSPRMNQRSDPWGGSFDARARFALAVVRAVRAATGPDFVLGFHMLAREYRPGGLVIDDAVQLAPQLQLAGADFLLPVSGTFEDLHTHAHLTAEAGYQLPETSAIAAVVDIPVIANGRLGDPADAARAIDDGNAAAVALARPLLADPDWPIKTLSGRAQEIVDCPCDPPECIRTQLDGVTCTHWPAAAQQQGYFGHGQ